MNMNEDHRIRCQDCMTLLEYGKCPECVGNMTRFELINAGWEPPKEAAKLKKEIRRLRKPDGVDVEGLCERLVKTIRNYHCHYAVEDADPTQPYPLIDALSHGQATVATGINEAEMLADEVNGVIKAHLHQQNLLKTNGDGWRDMSDAPMDGDEILGNYGNGEECLIFWSENPVCMLGPRNGSFPAGWATCGPDVDSNLPMDEPESWKEPPNNVEKE